MKMLRNHNDVDGKIVGKGLVNGIVFSNPEYAAKIREKCFQRGLILELCGAHDEVVKIMPSSCIDYSILNSGMEIIDSVLREL
ncbi:MAG: hypothetical protein LBD03_08510 [Methanobrevibacter sp.]|jgi:diaminobutyrate-2-oxoglutarate transaminase|nr:hypothetical protein [Candidatus Methanovirga procula]